MKKSTVVGAIGIAVTAVIAVSEPAFAHSGFDLVLAFLVFGVIGAIVAVAIASVIGVTGIKLFAAAGVGFLLGGPVIALGSAVISELRAPDEDCMNEVRRECGREGRGLGDPVEWNKCLSEKYPRCSSTPPNFRANLLSRSDNDGTRRRGNQPRMVAPLILNADRAVNFDFLSRLPFQPSDFQPS